MRVAVIAVVLAGIVAGCSSGEPSRPAGSTTHPPPLTIPPVARPLNVSAFAADSCGLLDAPQRSELGLTTVRRQDGASDNACDLDTDDDPTSYLRLVVFDTGGLADQYAQCDTLDCSQWTTDTIDGYPVIRATDEMISKYGSCKLLLGVADNATVAIIDVQIDTTADGPNCERADRVASMTLATLTRG
jgi:Protein of unknown function (DUF3558)